MRDTVHTRTRCAGDSHSQEPDGRLSGTTVWQEANFSVNRGEFVAVIGPNGAGKTTMFRLLLGLQQPISGIDKCIRCQAPRRGNPKIGYVPQRHTIDNETNIECIELVRLAFSGNKWGLSLPAQAEKKVAPIRWLRSGQRNWHTNRSVPCPEASCRGYSWQRHW